MPPPEDGKTWSDCAQAFAAACAEQSEAERLSYRSRSGETLLLKNLVADHYLPSIKDAAPNTRKNTASHLGDGSGLPRPRRALRSGTSVYLRVRTLWPSVHVRAGLEGPVETGRPPMCVPDGEQMRQPRLMYPCTARHAQHDSSS